MGWDSPSHWLILGLIVLVLFGYKKLPEMSRSVGRSLRIFKTEMKGMTEDDSAREAQTAAQPVTPPVLPGTPVAPPTLTKTDDGQTAAQGPATETSRETPQ